MKIFKKLIRDKIPEIMEREGKKLSTRVLTDDKEYIEALLRKMIEEVQELRHGDDPREKIAYLYEIIDALIAAHGFNKEEIFAVRKTRYKERGGFDKRLFLEGVLE
ncbi:MAG: nucleoside triphosphate pyrophosphohydrolase [Candidatus Sungbacteria bacterium]|nr:nucleoside triphosphate pyrophosphohydrolase [Candidatus Sungbacteria bacterium]